MLISDRADFRARKLVRDKQGHYVMIKWSVPQEDITVANVFAPNQRVSKYVRQKLINCKEKQMNLPQELETSTPLYQKGTDRAGRKPVRT